MRICFSVSRHKKIPPLNMNQTDLMPVENRRITQRISTGSFYLFVIKL